jgi:hypothetical protein
MNPTQLMPTLGEISRRLGEPAHRIAYVLRTRGIRPACVAGRYRVYREEDVKRIAVELRNMDARKTDLRESDNKEGVNHAHR